MTYEEWFEKFKPIKNQIHPGQGFDDTLFETYGEDLEHVLIVNETYPDRVWTYVSGDAETITDGYHTVNRMGYFITEIPCPPDTFIEIPLDDDGDIFDRLVDEATHAVNDLVPDEIIDSMTADEQSDFLTRVNDALTPILSEVFAAHKLRNPS